MRFMEIRQAISHDVQLYLLRVNDGVEAYYVIEEIEEQIGNDESARDLKAAWKLRIKNEVEPVFCGAGDIKLLPPKAGGFVNLSTELSALISKESTAHKALRRFMDGNFKKYVES